MHAVSTKERAVITGIGVDIVPIERLAAETDPAEFLRQILTDEEIANAPIAVVLFETSKPEVTP